MEIPSEFELRKRLEALKQARESCEERKIELFRGINRLKQDLQEGSIDEQRYNAEIAKLPKSPQQIISECNSEIAAIEAGIDSCREQLERLNDDRNRERVRTVAILAMLLLFSVGLPLLTIKLTGFVVSEDITAYNQDIGINFTSSQAFALNVERTGGAGELRSLLLGGKLIGDGKVSVYLEKGAERYLILNETAIKQKGVTSVKALTSITGRAVSEVSEGEKSEVAAAAKEAKAEESKDKDKQKDKEKAADNETNATINETQTQPEPEVPAVPVEKAINISMAYKQGTIHDANDDGVELDIFAIDFTVGQTNFSWAADEQKLCTRWVTKPSDSDTATAVCHGSSECCALIELAPYEESWNEAFNVFVGRYGATYNNTVSSQVIYANYSLDPANVYSEIYYSSFATLPATFVTVPPLEEGVANETNATLTVVEFNNVCVETCSLSGIAGLNLSEYTLVIEVENATLELDNATYTLAKVTEIDIEAPVVTILTPQNTTYTEAISAAESRNTTALSLSFTVSEPASWVGYSLNGQANVTITAAATTMITAANRTNSLILYAMDEAGNVGYAVAEFFINFTTAAVIDTEPPIIAVISPLPNATYNTTAVQLNFTLSEPATISYFLNLQNKTEIASNVTLAAEEGRNRLLLLATDIAGNVAHESVVFFVNTSNVTIAAAAPEANITPFLKSRKDHFKLDEDAELEFEYIKKSELVRVGKWKDGYEGYEGEDDYEEFLETVSAARKEQIKNAVAVEKRKAKPKKVKEFVEENETIVAELFDAYGRETAIKPVIEEEREGRFRLSVPSQRIIRPGYYTLQVELTKGNETFVEKESFVWGLISLNTAKSIYKPGQTAELITVVLDQYGKAVSSADITIAITSPDNSSVVLTSQNGQVVETSDSGVYTAAYIPGLEGNYSVVAATVVNGMPLQFDTYFLALNDYKFDIIRNTKSKIDPTTEPTHAVVVAIEDLQPQNSASTAVTIREFVPAVFEITAAAAGAEITTVKDAKVISWNRELADNKATVSYSYSVPKLWPRLYTLGQAEITAHITTTVTAAATTEAEAEAAAEENATQTATSTFTEARPWYVAVDPVGKTLQKTVEYFVMQNWSQDVGGGALQNWSIVNVYIPENGALKLKSAWLDVFFGMSAAGTVAGGASGVQVNGTTAWRFGQGGADSGEWMLFNYLANVTSALAQSGFFRTGPNVYNFSINITPSANTGTVNAKSAKLYLTYEYDDSSQEQLQTVHRFVGMLDQKKTDGLGIVGTTVSLNSVNFSFQNVSAGLPSTAVVRDAWVEIYGVVGGDTQTDEYINVTFTGEPDRNDGLIIDMADGGPAPFRLLYKPNSFNPKAYNTMNISVGGGANNVTGLSAELVMTYSFDTAAGNGRLETMRYLLGQNNTNNDMGAVVSLPQSAVTIQDAYVVVTGTIGVATSATTDASRRINYSVSIPGTNNDNRLSSSTLRQSVITAAVNALSFRLLYNASTLKALANGNTVNCTIIADAAGLGSHGCELIVTFNYSYSDSTTLAKTVGFFAGSSGAGPGETGPITAAITNLTSTFNVNYPSDEGTITNVSPYFWVTSPNVHLATWTMFQQNISNSTTSQQLMPFANPDSEQLLTWGYFNATNLINTTETTYRLGLSSPTASTYNAWAWITYSYGAPPLARIVDNSFTTNDTSILEGEEINITGNYSNTGNVASNWNLTLNATGTNGVGTLIDRDCSDAGDGFQVTDIIARCGTSTTLPAPGNCTESSTGIQGDVATGSVIANLSKTGDFMNITWILKACTGAATNSPYIITTNATNVTNSIINATSFTKSVTITVTAPPPPPDTTAPNVSIIVPSVHDINNTNVSGLLVINASVNDTENRVFNVNLTLHNGSGNITTLIPMNLSAYNLTSGYWNKTFDSTTLTDGFYNLSVNATDSAPTPNTGISANVSITIDNTGANVTAIAPLNGTLLNGTILINASVNDTLSKVLNASFRLTTETGSTVTAWLYASVNGTQLGNRDQGYWNTTIDTRTLNDSIYYITINATDYAQNQRLVNISRIEIDNIQNASVIVPAQDSNFSGNMLVRASANSTNLDILSVNLTISNYTGNATGMIVMTLGVGTATSGYWNVTFDTTTLRDDKYNLSVNVTTQGTSTNITTNISITIDNTKPNATAVAPANFTIQNGTMLINASVDDNQTKVFNVTFRLATPTGSMVTDWLYATNGTGTITNGTWNTTIDTRTLNDSIYNITINATDFAGNQLIINMSQIEIDNIPNASIFIPAANTNISGIFMINASANSTNLGVLNVNLTISNYTGNATTPLIMNLSAGSLTSGHWNTTFDSTTLRDAIYNLSANVTTQQGTNVTANITITIDNTKPNATGIRPLNNTNLSGSFVINASVNDTTALRNVTFMLYNSTENATGWHNATRTSGANSIQGYWTITLDGTTLRDAAYNITVNATDTAGNQLIVNVSAFAIDNTKPNVTIAVPVNNSNVSSSFLINASVNDTSAILNVTFRLSNFTGNVTTWLNASRTSGADSIQGYWTITANSVEVADGIYNITINATDTAGNQQFINSSTITVDNTKPNATAVAPANFTIQNGTILINASVNDSTSRVFNVSFRLETATGGTKTDWLPSTVNGTELNNIVQGYWTATFNTRTLNDSTYNITINATDYAGNQLILNISQIEIDNIPNASIFIPAANTNISGTFMINASANSTSLGVLNVNLTISNNTGNATTPLIMNLSAGSLTSGHWNTTFDSTTLRDATYNLSANITTQQGTNVTANITITIDNTRLNGTIITPANATNIRGFFNINASVNDTLSKVQNVSFRLRLPGTEGPLAYAALKEGTIDQGNWNVTFNSSTVPNGIYNITLNASDFAGNLLLVNTTNVVINNSGFLNITFNGPKGGRNITQNRTFSVNATITCLSGYCQDVNATVYYNLTSISPATRINATALEVPFHNVTSYVNQTCNYMEIDAVCSLNWTINATGAIGSRWFFSINFTSNNSETVQNGTSNFQINITELVVTNTAPIVFNNSVALNSTVTLTEGTTKVVMVKFNVTDADGTSDIANAAVGVNISFNGIRRANNSGNCVNLGDSSSTTRLFSCNVTFNYFDNSSTLWEINITAADAAGLVGYNDSTPGRGGGAANNLTINSLSAFAISLNSTAASASTNDQNVELSFVINNTGNFDFTILNITPFDLNASLTDLFRLNGNFSINSTASTGTGLGQNILNGTPTNFTDISSSAINISATLQHRTTGGASDYVLGNRTLYIYIDIPINKGLSTGVTYNVSQAWELFAS